MPSTAFCATFVAIDLESITMLWIELFSTLLLVHWFGHTVLDGSEVVDLGMLACIVLLRDKGFPLI